MLASTMLALAAAPAAQPLDPSGAWTLSAKAGVCAATRPFGAGAPTMLRLVATPLTGQYLLSVDLARPIEAAFDDDVTITTEPDRHEATGPAIGIVPNDPAPRTVGLAVPQSLLRTPGTMRLAVHGREIVSLALDDPAPIAARLAACVDDVLRGYGIDPTTQTAVATWPEPVGGAAQWFTADAYPPAARRIGAQGRVVVRLTVAADGTVSDYAPVRRSGIAELDDGTCPVVMARAHYRPARDGHGRPVAAPQLLATRWVLPSG